MAAAVVEKEDCSNESKYPPLTAISSNTVRSELQQLVEEQPINCKQQLIFDGLPEIQTPPNSLADDFGPTNRIRSNSCIGIPCESVCKTGTDLQSGIRNNLLSVFNTLGASANSTTGLNHTGSLTGHQQQNASSIQSPAPGVENSLIAVRKLSLALGLDF